MPFHLKSTKKTFFSFSFFFSLGVGKVKHNVRDAPNARLSFPLTTLVTNTIDVPFHLLDASDAMLFLLIIFITKHYLLPFPFPFMSMFGSCSIATSLVSLHSKSHSPLSSRYIVMATLFCTKLLCYIHCCGHRTFIHKLIVGRLHRTLTESMEALKANGKGSRSNKSVKS